jgi:hypothetical protein
MRCSADAEAPKVESSVARARGTAAEQSGIRKLSATNGQIMQYPILLQEKSS